MLKLRHSPLWSSCHAFTAFTGWNDSLFCFRSMRLPDRRLGTEVKNLTVNKYLEWCRFDFFSNKYMCYPAKDHFSWYGDVSEMHRFPDNVTTVMMRRDVETAHIKWQHKTFITFLLMTWEDWRCLKSIVQMLMSCAILFLYVLSSFTWEIGNMWWQIGLYQKLIR